MSERWRVEYGSDVTDDKFRIEVHGGGLGDEEARNALAERVCAALNAMESGNP